MYHTASMDGYHSFIILFLSTQQAYYQNGILQNVDNLEQRGKEETTRD